MGIMKLLLILADTTDALPSYEGVFLKMILTLAALVVGIIGSVWFFKRMTGGRVSGTPGRSIQVLERKALSPKTMLYLIDVDGKQSVIAESQLEVRRLMTLDTFVEPEKEEV
jgi:flagellar protein FliO/FliZ